MVGVACGVVAGSDVTDVTLLLCQWLFMRKASGNDHERRLVVVMKICVWTAALLPPQAGLPEVVA